jgi:hypothetical protein
MHRSRLLALGALVTSAAVVGGLAAPVGAAPKTSDASQRVTLVLAPKDRAALRAVAAQHGKANPAAIKAALPSAAARADVSRVVASLGFRVERTTALTVEVSAPATRVRSYFGSARSVRADRARAQALPRIPASLRPLVTVAFGGDENRPAFSPMAGATGAQLRSEYGVATALPTTAPGAAVATVQLSDWNAADLTHYAADLAGPAPKLTQINDSGYPAELSTDDSVEVDLDQQAIYAVAPNARQRLYKSENQLGGMYNSLIHIGDDALDGVDDNIVAASISWGFCEASIGTDAAAAQLFNAFEDVLSYVLATGVTVFASSGDDGTTCDPDGPSGPAPAVTDVSYPASSPQVVAVGGTTTLGAGRTSWDDPSAGSGGGVSGVFAEPTWQVAAAGNLGGRAVPDLAALGGAPGFDVYSSTAGGPAGYLTGVKGTSLASPVAAASFATSLATAAAHPYGIGNVLSDLYDNVAGFTDVTASGDGGSGGPAASAAVGYDLATGLGVPQWDALVGLLPGAPHLTPTGLSNRYFSDPTNVTYRVVKSMAGIAAGTSATYRVDDVTFTNPSCAIQLGTPAANSNPSFTGSYDVTLADPFYTAGSHDYDGVYTLAVIENAGGVCRVGLRNATVDTVAPAVTSAPVIRPAAGTGPKATITWTASDSLSGLASYPVILKRYNPNGTFKDQQLLNATTGSLTFTPSLGYGYVAYVKAIDRAGNASGYRASSRTTLYDNANFGYSSGWSSAASTGDFGGSSRYTSLAGRYASRSAVAAKVYYVIARTGPAYGKATVKVGTVSRTVDLYSSTLKQRVLVFAFSGAAGSRAVVVQALGARNSRSSGTTVVFDGLLTVS